jgi:hypothetical protein
MMRISVWFVAPWFLAAAATTTASAQPRSEIDPGAIAALERMGGYLRAQQVFRVRTTIETDYEIGEGQKVQLSSQGELNVRRPDHLRADVVSDRMARRFFYDGKTFTMYGPRIGYYARVLAPPTILQTADMLEDRYGLELPMVDLFRWGTAESDIGAITSATRIGTAMIDGVLTDQYAFRQAGLDWQIWIERGAHPLPRQLVLTTTDDAARPQRTISMRWDLRARPSDAMFTFVPSRDSRRITLSERPGSGSSVAMRAPQSRGERR